MQTAPFDSFPAFSPVSIRTTPDWLCRIEAISQRLDARWQQLDPVFPDPDVLALQLTCSAQRLEFESALELLASR